MAIWDDVISEQDREVYEASGFGREGTLSGRLALLVVDVTYGFTGPRGMPLLESVARFRTSCGPPAWEAVDVIADLIAACRSAEVPVIYTRGRPPSSVRDLGRWGSKSTRASEDVATGVEAHTIVREIGPADGDLVVTKDKPSGFHGTALVGHLIDMGIDSLLVTGCTTSGCVRATVVDAFSYNFPVAVVQEGVFDRGEVSHKVNLFDMQAKYADIVTHDQARALVQAATVPATSRA